jgi:hypothetical protein
MSWPGNVAPMEENKYRFLIETLDGKRTLEKTSV